MKEEEEETMMMRMMMMIKKELEEEEEERRWNFCKSDTKSKYGKLRKLTGKNAEDTQGLLHDRGIDRPFAYPSVRLTVCPSGHPSVRPSVRPPARPSVPPSVRI